MIGDQNIVFTGTVKKMCTYFSKEGKVIMRAKSSLTGARVAKDPAFKGFRASGNRMKEASPIASALYNQLPKEKKEYKLYRILTGEALKMIKEGIAAEEITQKLQELYIDPLLQKEEVSTPQAPVIALPVSTKKGRVYLGRNKQYRKFKMWFVPGEMTAADDKRAIAMLRPAGLRLYFRLSELHKRYRASPAAEVISCFKNTKQRESNVKAM